jgi:hypothetical protein
VDKHPNTLLTKIRSALTALTRDRSVTQPDALRELIENMTTLDHHLNQGGPAPVDWGPAFPTPAPQATDDHPNDLFRPAHPDTASTDTRPAWPPTTA